MLSGCVRLTEINLVLMRALGCKSRKRLRDWRPSRHSLGKGMLGARLGDYNQVVEQLAASLAQVCDSADLPKNAQAPASRVSCGSVHWTRT